MRRTEILTTLIETRRHVAAGWIQFGWEDERGCCLIGALNRACDALNLDSVDDYEIHLAVYNRIRAQLPEIGENTPLMAWNDAPGRTQAEVLDACDRAIAAMLAERGGARADEAALAFAPRERELEAV